MMVFQQLFLCASLFVCVMFILRFTVQKEFKELKQKVLGRSVSFREPGGARQLTLYIIIFGVVLVAWKSSRSPIQDMLSGYIHLSVISFIQTWRTVS